MTLDHVAIKQNFENLMCEVKSLQLATVDGKGVPLISYAPFVHTGGCFYIFISQLADHTQHLTNGSAVSAMVIRDEQGTRNLYARERLTLVLEVLPLSRGDEKAEKILEQLERRQGKTVKLLRSLPDFLLFQLTPSAARYVAGFGKAYDIDCSTGNIRHVGPETENVSEQ